MPFFRLLRRCYWLLIAAIFSIAPAAMAAETLESARSLLLHGKYDEAIDVYQSLTSEHPVSAAIGIARAHRSIGQLDEARAILEKTLADHPDDADLHADLAQLAFDRGQTDVVDKHIAAALAADSAQLRARWLAAERLRLQGKLIEADEAYHWFIKYYNDHDRFEAEDLCWIGLGAAQYARWNRLSDQFSFLVNELYPDAVKLDALCWRAYLDSGLLFLEKYNQVEASKEIEKALAINPASADVLAAVAALALQDYELDKAKRSLDEALAINPRHVEALYLYADSHLAKFEFDEAIDRLEKARELNPTSEQVLGRLAAVYGVRDGLANRGDGTSRMGQMILEAEKRNPHNGEFYVAVGATLDLLRKYPTAVEFYREALAKMPQLVETRGALGMLHMRMGDETEAARLFRESFEIDPFNVRVSNTLKVLEVLDTYAVIETPHFVIRFDRGHDEVLAWSIAAYLEDEVYPELTKRFDFEPEGKSLFEIFNRARNTGGHGWFSARMVGLPYVGTVGACAGKMVAMVSPGDMPKKFNWARVVKHEFVHVLNLQQTHFNIPHWYTEALAVESEGFPRPQEWNDLLVRRMKADNLFNLDDINLGFLRPGAGDDWTLAYCQAQLYAQYMVATYGEDALAKMLAAYRDNLDTRAALRHCFGVDQQDFEAGYTEYLEKFVASLDSGDVKAEKPLTFAELQRAQQDKPDDPELAARLAHEYLLRQSNADARRLADLALKAKPGHPLATYVVARLKMSIGENDEAITMLEKVFDEADPDPRVLRLLANVEAKRENYERAMKLYRLGAKEFPNDAQWLKSLAAVCIKSGDEAQLQPVLEQLAVADADDVLIRKKLVELAIEAKDNAAVRRWATEALHIDVNDATLHYQLGRALAAEGEKEKAIESLRLAVRLDENDAEARELLEELAP